MRAQALKNVNFEKLMDVTKQMNDIKNENLEELNTPNWMWVTFAEDIAFHAALEEKRFKFQDNELKLKRAQHPSDIKYENR